MLERLDRLKTVYGLEPDSWRSQSLGCWPDESRQCLFRRLAREGDGTAAAELLKALPDRVSPDLASVVLESTLGPSAPLFAVRSDLPMRVLDFLDEAARSVRSAWNRLRDALDEALSAATRFPWQRAMAERVCSARSRAAREGGTLVDRMRRVRELDRIARVFQLESSVEMLRAQALETARLPLDGCTLRVVLAHAVPLSRLDPRLPGAAEVAVQLSNNLCRWRLLGTRVLRRWSASSSADQGAAAVVAPPQGQAEHTALVELNRVLGTAVEEVADGRALQLPPELHVERALNDLGQVLADRALPRWLGEAEATALLLRFLAGTRGLRLRLGPLLRQTLDGRQPEPVQRAAVRLTAAFVSGLGGFDAWSAVAARNEVLGRTEGLQAEQKLIVESDGELCSLLETVVREAGRPGAVRSDALFVLLSAGLSQAQVRRLADLGIQGDEPLVRAVLRWAVRHRAHSALETLRSLHSRRQDLSPELRRQLFRALAATGHMAVAEVLTPDFLSGCPEARQAVASLGTPLRARQLESEVRVARWTAANKRHDQRRRSLSDEAAKHRSQALRFGIQADAAAIDAAGHGAAGQALTVEMHAECAALELLLGSLLEQLERRVAERDRLYAVCQRRLSEIRALHDEMATLRGEIDRLVQAVRSEEKQAATLGRQAEEADRQLSEAGRQASELADELRGLSSTRSTLEYRLRGVQPEDREGRERLGRELATLEGRTGEATRRLAQARARESSLPGKIRSLEREQERARARAARLEDRAAELRLGLDPLLRERDELAELARETRGELRELDAVIVRLRDRCREVRHQAEEAARRFAAALQECSARLEQALELQERLRQETEAHLYWGRRCDERISRHAAAMVRLDQQVAERLAAMQRTIPAAAEEVAEMDSRCARAEKLHDFVRRRSAELRLNLDLLMHFLSRFGGPTSEARRIGNYVNMDWAAVRVGDLARKGDRE